MSLTRMEIWLRMKMNIYSSSCFLGGITKKQEERLKNYNITKEEDDIYIEINTLEELLDAARLLDEDLIIGFNKYKNNEVKLEIYDDYRE